MAGTSGNKQYKLAVEIAGKVASSFNTAMGKAQGTLSKLGSAVGTMGKVAAAAIGAATAAAVAFAKSSVDVGRQFDKSMAQVAATMGTSVDQIGDLRDFAMEMGRTTQYSASEAADALNYMALAGYDAETSMAMLPNVLNLAAAGGIDLASASDMITDAQSALGLTLEQTNAMVDQMAKTSSKSNTSVAQLGEAILTVGGTAQYMAGGTEELNAVLGVLADNSIKGSEGGTHLRNILLKLASPTADATKLLNQLGVDVFDAEGNMRSFTEIFPELNAAMSTLTAQERLDAMATLFNSRDIASATALLSTTTDRWNELGAAIGDCNGAAAQMAETQLDNLEGDITKFKSALEGAKITLSDQLTPSLRQFTQFGTRAITSLSDAFKEGGLSGAMGALGGIISEGLSMVVQAAPQAIDAGMQLLGALGQGILDNLPTITDSAIEVCLMFAQGIVSAIPRLGDAAVQLVTSLASSLQQRWPEIAQTGGDLLSALFNGIMTGLPLLAQGAATLMQNLGKYLQENLPTLLQQGLQAVVQLTGSIRQNAGLIVDGALSLITSLAQGIADSLPVLIQNIPTIVSNIANTINDNAPKVLGAAVNIIVTLGKGLISAIPTLIANIPQIIAAIWDTITAVNWVNLGGAIIKGLGGGITAMIDFVKSSITTVKNSLKSGIQNLPDAFKTIGKNLINGLIDGVKSMVSGAVSKVKEFGASILSGIKSVFGIHSPSKEMAWVGEMLVDGLTGSIQENGGQAVEAAAGLASNVNTAMQGIAGNAELEATAAYTTAANPQPIPAMAQGGIVNGPTVLQAGEEGAEAIVPLANLWDRVQGIAGNAVAGISEKISALREKLDALDTGGNGSLVSELLRGLDPGNAPGGQDEPVPADGPAFNITYSPHYHFEGGPAPTKEDLTEAERQSQEEFDRRMAKWQKDNQRKRF